MKKIVLLIVVTLFYVSNLTAQKNNPYDYVGQEHNKGLDYIYQKLVELKKYNKNLKFKKKNNIDLIKKYTIEFIEKERKNRTNNKFKLPETEYVKKFLDTIYPFLSTGPYFPTDVKKNINLGYKFEEYVNTILTNNSNTRELISLVNTIKNDKNLNSIEKNILLSSVSVEYNSFNYWRINGGKWQGLIGGGSQYVVQWVKADLNGAFWGVITGVKEGLVLGPEGAAAAGLAGAMIGGIFSSAIDLLP